VRRLSWGEEVALKGGTWDHQLCLDDTRSLVVWLCAEWLGTLFCISDYRALQKL
jgi:hypothetical protein